MKRVRAKIAAEAAAAVVDTAAVVVVAAAVVAAAAAAAAAVTSANGATGNCLLVFLFQNAKLALGRLRVLVEAIHQ